MSDVYLFPQEPNAADVRLREPSAPSALYTVEVSVTATGAVADSRTLALTRTGAVTAVGSAATAAQPGLTLLAVAAGIPSVAFEVIPAEVEPEPPPVSTGGGGGRRRPRLRPTAPPFRLPRRYHVHLSARAHGQATVGLVVDHAGRRAQEDELVLVGAT